MPIDWSWNGWNAIAAIGQWAGVFVTITGFAFVIKQQKQERIALESQTTAQVYEVGIEILKVFVEMPELRPYFYNNQHPPMEELKNSQVFATAEMIADHWENIFLFGGSLDEETREVWRVYMKSIYNRSPALREHLQLEGFRYAKSFLAVFDANLPATCQAGNI